MTRRPVIAILGAGREIEPAVASARELGRRIAENTWVLMTGGRDAGVMRAANEGAKEVKQSVTVGILPDRDAEIASAVDIAIVTDTGQARNNVIVLSADVIIACGVDGAGTASEVSLAIKNEKQVILLGVDDTGRRFFQGIGRDRVHFAETPEEAIEIAKRILSITGNE